MTQSLERESVDFATPHLPNGARVAIVHDYLTQRGGAERVVLSLMEAFPGARLITSLYDADATFPEFAAYDIETTWLNRLTPLRRDPRRAVPFLPVAFSRRRLEDVDLVICSSSGWSHGIRTDAPKIVYCHNPARWLYQSELYVGDYSPAVRAVVRVVAPLLRRWDRRSAMSASAYLANSYTVASRIDAAYGRRAAVVPPPVTVDPRGQHSPIPGLEPGFFLTVGRSRGYKNADVVRLAMDELPGERLVVVGGNGADASDRVMVLTDLSDAEMRWLYANCAALIAASHEDFGLTPVEAYRFGKPSICLRAGGFLDTMREGVTGLFFDDLTPGSLATAVRAFSSHTFDASAIKRHGDAFGPEIFADRVHAAAWAALET